MRSSNAVKNESSNRTTIASGREQSAVSVREKNRNGLSGRRKTRREPGRLELRRQEKSRKRRAS
jgi:hypothetical protein